MEIDTGASVSIVPSSMCKKKLESLTKKLRSATGQLMKLAGQTVVNVQVEGETKQLKLYVAREECPSLFGREWIHAFFGKNWILTNKTVHSVEEVEMKLNKILE